MHIFMTTDEMQRSIDERYCAGMEFAEVVAQIEADELTYFVTDEGGNQRVEARLLRPGFSRRAYPEFGRLLFGFDDGELSSAVYGTPIDDGSWDYTRYRLEDCEASGLRVESEGVP